MARRYTPPQNTKRRKKPFDRTARGLMKKQLNEFFKRKPTYQANNFPKKIVTHALRVFLQLNILLNFVAKFLPEAKSNCVFCKNETNPTGDALISCHGLMNGERCNGNNALKPRKSLGSPCSSKFHESCALEYNAGNHDYHYAAYKPCQAALVCPLHNCEACGTDNYRQSSYSGIFIDCAYCLRAFHPDCCPAGSEFIEGMITMESGRDVKIMMIKCPSHLNNPSANKSIFEYLKCCEEDCTENSRTDNLVKCKTCPNSFHKKCRKVEDIDGQAPGLDQCSSCLTNATIRVDTPVVVDLETEKLLAHIRSWNSPAVEVLKNDQFYGKVGYVAFQGVTDSSLVQIVKLSHISLLDSVNPLNVSYEDRQFWQHVQSEYAEKEIHPKVLKKVYKEITRMPNATIATEEHFHDFPKCGCDELSPAQRCATDTCMYVKVEQECPPGCWKDCRNRKISNGYLTDNLKLVATDVKGYGVYPAATNIVTNEFMGEYVGEPISNKEKLARSEMVRLSKDIQAPHYMLTNGTTTIDAAAKGNITRYINHSCDPNAAVHKISVLVVVGGRKLQYQERRFVKAIRPISTIEEVTIGYGFGVGNLPKCRCEAKGFCDGIMSQKRQSPNPGVQPNYYTLSIVAPPKKSSMNVRTPDPAMTHLKAFLTLMDQTDNLFSSSALVSSPPVSPGTKSLSDLLAHLMPDSVNASPSQTTSIFPTGHLQQLMGMAKVQSLTSLFMPLVANSMQNTITQQDEEEDDDDLDAPLVSANGLLQFFAASTQSRVDVDIGDQHEIAEVDQDGDRSDGYDVEDYESNDHTHLQRRDSHQDEDQMEVFDNESKSSQDMEIDVDGFQDREDEYRIDSPPSYHAEVSDDEFRNVQNMDRDQSDEKSIGDDKEELPPSHHDASLSASSAGSSLSVTSPMETIDEISNDGNGNVETESVVPDKPSRSNSPVPVESTAGDGAGLDEHMEEAIGKVVEQNSEKSHTDTSYGQSSVASETVSSPANEAAKFPFSGKQMDQVLETTQEEPTSLEPSESVEIVHSVSAQSPTDESVEPPAELVVVTKGSDHWNPNKKEDKATRTMDSDAVLPVYCNGTEETLFRTQTVLETTPDQADTGLKNAKEAGNRDEIVNSTEVVGGTEDDSSEHNLDRKTRCEETRSILASSPLLLREIDGSESPEDVPTSASISSSELVINGCSLSRKPFDIKEMVVENTSPYSPMEGSSEPDFLSTSELLSESTTLPDSGATKIRGTKRPGSEPQCPIPNKIAGVNELSASFKSLIEEGRKLNLLTNFWHMLLPHLLEETGSPSPMNGSQEVPTTPSRKCTCEQEYQLGVFHFTIKFAKNRKMIRQLYDELSSNTRVGIPPGI